MHVSIALLLELGLILAVLSVLGALARRVTLSPIPLYLLAGLALGEGGVLPVPAAGQFVQSGASIGIVLLLLALGLEFSIGEFAASMRHHLPSAGVDLLVNVIPGVVAGWLLGLDGIGILALAGVTYISSSGIIARLLGDLRRLGNRETPAVLSVLVLEDFAMAAYLPVLAVLASGGTWWQAMAGALVAVGAVLAAFAASCRWGRHIGRLVEHPDDEQLMLRVLGLTMVVAALAEYVHASAAVGAFLVGLTLTGQTVERARAVIAPLRDLFAAVFFVAIGLSVAPAELLPVLPVALVLAVTTGLTKVLTGWYAASRDGVGRRGRLRAGAALIARGEFSIVIVGLTGAQLPALAPLVAAYVFVLAVTGPLITRFTGIRHTKRPSDQPPGSSSALPNGWCSWAARRGEGGGDPCPASSARGVASAGGQASALMGPARSRYELLTFDDLYDTGLGFAPHRRVQQPSDYRCGMNGRIAPFDLRALRVLDLLGDRAKADRQEGHEHHGRTFMSIATPTRRGDFDITADLSPQNDEKGPAAPSGDKP